MTANHRALNDTIDRIVNEACLPGEDAREDLRRELASYFEESDAAEDSMEEAIARFGSPTEISQNFQQVYRTAFLWCLAGKLLVAVILGAAVSEAFLALTHLRLTPDHVVYLSSSFFRAYGFGIKVALGLAAAWEMGRRPFRLRRAIGVFAAYCAIVTVLQAFVFRGLHGWEPWHTPNLIGLGFLASRLRKTSLRVTTMFAGFFAYLTATSSHNTAERLALAVALLVIWTLTERLFAMLDQGVETWFRVAMESSLTSRGQSRRVRADSHRHPPRFSVTPN